MHPFIKYLLNRTIRQYPLKFTKYPINISYTATNISYFIQNVNRNLKFFLKTEFIGLFCCFTAIWKSRYALKQGVTAFGTVFPVKNNCIKYFVLTLCLELLI